MRARTKLTLLTAGFTLFVAIGFSTIIFLEMLEQPFRLLDRELDDLSEMIRERIVVLHKGTVQQPMVLGTLPYANYWISVRESATGKVAMESPMARGVGFSVVAGSKAFFVTVDANNPFLDQYNRYALDLWLFSGMVLRVHHVQEVIAGREFEIITAKPIPVLIHELVELVLYLLLAWVVCAVAVVCFSYLLSGKILQPIVRINSLAREITENSLNRRLPESDSNDELAALIRSLNSMFDRLENSFHRQREFVGNAAHELKSPLAALMLGCEKLLTDELPPSVYLTLEKQLEILRRLAHLVADLLEISRLEQHQRLFLEPLDIKQLLDEILEEFEPLFQERKITVVTNLESCVVSADREKIMRLFINLLDNAIKYNEPEGGQIKITLARQAELAECKISNTGRQIPDEYLDKIFDQFFRVEQSRAAQFGGAGLGLTIARQIVEIHHGSIRAVSGTGGWTGFVVDLPLADFQH